MVRRKPTKSCAKTPVIKRSKSKSLQNVESCTIPHPNDVISGRGGLTNNHEGNVLFRRLVTANKDIYHSSSKTHKPLLAESIVVAIANQEGRFLAQHKSTGEWFDIGKAKAIKKTCQALREGVKPR
mmetsp:Transcript_4830/g.7462  ORF Transcript_4830/g.7462 Transcript_4830/m.7462 type:complete len:126 (-) Transcript_4830:614-991(-)